jgi:hypothetical protein
MSQKENSDQQNQDLTEKVSEYVPTDVIVDLKSGIYNLFVSLVNNLMLHHGAVEAVRQATDFIDSISHNFKQTLPENQEK